MRTREPDAILANEERFLERLGTSHSTLERVWAISGAASVGMLVASSSVVATTFFPSSGWLALVGLGVAATTPVGWVLAAGAVTGGVYTGVRWWMDKFTVKRRRRTDTPVELLATKLLGFMLPLSIWIAKSDDGEVSEEEKDSIVSFYAEEWGYVAGFVICKIGALAGEVAIKTAGELAKSLSDYCGKNPDCNRKGMIKVLVGHLHEFAGTEGNDESRERKTRALRELETEFVRRTGWWSR